MPANANPMRDQVAATPAALQAQFADVERTARLVLDTPAIYRTRRLVLVGSGDSFFAAKAAEWSLLAHSGIPVEIRPPLEAGRYHASLSARRDLENTLVIAISNSGAAARVCEAAHLYRRAGANVLAVTKNPDSRLAGMADRTLVVPVPPMPPAPGFGPYLFALVALLLLGIRIGEVRMSMTMDAAQALRQSLNDLFGDLGETIAATEAPARSVAESLGRRRIFEFVGAGPNVATAEYGAAKVLEATGHHAIARELEEWTHLNYFDAAPDEIATFMILPADSRASGRAEELFGYMHKLGRGLVIVGGGSLAARGRDHGHHVLPVQANVTETWSPLLLSAPLALFAAHLAEIDGTEYGRGGRGPWDDSADAGTVQKSQLWEPGA